MSATVHIKDAAASPGTVSTTPSDIIAYEFSIGGETWSGTGADFLGIFRFEISADGRTLFFRNAGGGLTSSPSGFLLDIVTNDPNPTEWIISDQMFFKEVATAVGNIGFTLSPDGIFADGFQPMLPEHTFALSGSLSTASAPFDLPDDVSGFMTLEASADVSCTVSTDPSDVVAYEFVIGDETWSGTGTDFLGIFRFEISADGRTLFFRNAGGGLTSSPSSFLLDIVTNDPNPTEWIISDQLFFTEVATAAGTMDFVR